MADPAAERVLIVEDEAAARAGLTELVRTWGFTADASVDGVDALEKAATFKPSIVVSDLMMPRMDGLALLSALRGAEDPPDVILITGMDPRESVGKAFEASKAGAHDYFTKPIDYQRLRLVLEKLAEHHAEVAEARRKEQAAKRESEVLRRQKRDHGRFGRIIGSARSMEAIYRVIEAAAPTTASVLVLGESGTGKELVAQRIHELSPRAHQAFVALNCAAIPETLLESEIFGHEKGAFTGAMDRRLGCFELADRGTLFLDEVAEMAPATQVKLLRVLQERTFRRLGGRQEISVDVRVIAATNVHPLEAVRAGKLREDLYYRLNVFAIEVPPLRDRREDLPLLVQAFIAEFNERNRKTITGLDPAAQRLVDQYRWPGNVRELRNAIERAVILSPGPLIEPSHLPAFDARPADAPRDGGPVTGPAMTLAPGMTVDDAETRLILMTLQHTHDNKTKAAELLGISLKTLHNKLNRLRDRDRTDDTAAGD
ncbi:MAG: sigma-54-dependent transcriptional regulator [Vicinamibacterales bacterium]